MKPSGELVRFARKLNELGIPWSDESDEWFETAGDVLEAMGVVQS